MAFVRRKGNVFYLVHNIRDRGKVRQLHLARLGVRPRITDAVVRQARRRHPSLELDWPRLRLGRGAGANRARSLFVQNLVTSIRKLNGDLTDLPTALLLISGSCRAFRDLRGQLRVLRSTLDDKLSAIEHAARLNAERGHKQGGRVLPGGSAMASQAQQLDLARRSPETWEMRAGLRSKSLPVRTERTSRNAARDFPNEQKK